MGQWNGWTKLVEDENGNLVRVLDPEKNTSEIDRIEKEIAALQLELAALKQIEN